MPNLFPRCTPFFAALAAVVFVSAAAAGCSSQREVEPERTASADEAIIGGVAVNAPSMNAVGSLVTITRYADTWSDAGERVYYGQPFCSATLIAPNAVVTAEHCTASLSPTAEFGFAMGPDGRNPVRVIPVVDFEVESTIKGGFINLGSDVAVLHLESPVRDVEPFAWGVLGPDDVGQRFVAVGYGTQDANGTAGTRRAGGMTLRGTEGKVFELAFGSFDAFKAKVSNIYDIASTVGDVTTSEGEKRARDIYDGRTLLAGGYEAFAGNAAGDAQTCHGDSGGPLLRRVGSKNTVFGVTSWGHHSTIAYNFCDFGGVFATFGPATQTFMTKALAWEDPCPATTAKGRCDGDVAVRCAAKERRDAATPPHRLRRARAYVSPGGGRAGELRRPVGVASSIPPLRSHERVAACSLWMTHGAGRRLRCERVWNRRGVRALEWQRRGDANRYGPTSGAYRPCVTDEPSRVAESCRRDLAPAVHRRRGEPTAIALGDKMHSASGFPHHGKHPRLLVRLPRSTETA